MMRYVLIALNILLSYALAAQLNGKYTFRHIDRDDGLLHSMVRDITQDGKGYIWIVTNNGLQRYDGHRFVNYPELYGDWITYDKMKDRVEVYFLDTYKYLAQGGDSMITKQAVDYLLHESKNMARYTWAPGHYCILDENAFAVFENDTFMSASVFDGGMDGCHYLLHDPITHQQWLIQGRSVSLIDPSSGHMESTLDENPKHTMIREIKPYLKKIDLKMGFIDSENNFWILTWSNYFFRYDLTSGAFYTYSLADIVMAQNNSAQPKRILSANYILEDSHRHLWISTENAGLLSFNRDKNTFQSITSQASIENGLKYEFTVGPIFEDRDGNIWLGTDRGIAIFNPYQEQFRSIRHLDNNPQSLPDNEILDVIQTSQGEILVSTSGGGITVFDSDWNFIRNIYFDKDYQMNMAWIFVEGDDGKIWAGCQGGFIHVLNPATHEVKTMIPPETNYYSIASAVKDPEGNILFGLVNRQVCTWNKKENKFYPHRTELDPIDTASRRSGLNQMILGPDHHVWLTSGSQLREFDVKTRAYLHYYPIGPLPYGYGDILLGMEVLNDSSLLVGTWAQGLKLFNLRTRVFSAFPNDSIFKNKNIYAIHRDHDGNFWCIGQFDLYKILPDGNVIRFTFDKAILRQELSDWQFRELKDGRMVTWGVAELICFHPDNLKRLDSKLNVEISSFKVFDKPVNIDSNVVCHQAVVLPYHQNFLSIEFATLTFMDIRHFNYYYRLQGVDNEWIRTDTRDFADYTDIKPGDYVFEVKASYDGSDGPITSLPIIITPPWWDTLLFKIFCILVLAAVIMYFVKRRIHTIRKEAELKQKISETEMMALRSQMNPHFIFNCLTSIDNLIQTNQKEKATTYLAKFAKLIRAILENSKSNVVSFWKDMETLQLYLELEELRWDKKIQYSIDIDPKIQDGDFKVPPLIIQPFVENAIHHGLLNKKSDDKILSIAAELEDHAIKYTIIDNGVGRQQAAEYKKANRSTHQSFGTQITRDRVDIFNRSESQSILITDLWDENQNAAGTRVVVWLTTEPETV